MNTGSSKFLQILDRICFVGSILFLSALAVWSIAGRFTALQLPSFLQEWLFPVFTAAAVGYLTNYLAILLLFRPYKPVKWLCGFQGVLPREQTALAKKMGEEIPAHLLPPEELSNQISTLVCHYLDDPQLPQSVRQKVCFYVKHRKEQISVQIIPYISNTASSVINTLITAENIRLFYREHGSDIMKREIRKKELSNTLLAELQKRVPDITSVIKRFVRSGAENYVQTEYPRLTNWVHADRFASQMVTNLNWELIQTKISEALTEPATRQMVQGELSSLEARLKNYISSEELETDIANIKVQYTENLLKVLQAQLAVKLPAVLEYVCNQDAVWQVFETEVLPAVKGFLLHQIKRNQSEIIDGLDLPGRIEKAILEQKPQEVHELVNRISGEHLVLLQLLGFLLGGIAGLLLVFVQI